MASSVEANAVNNAANSAVDKTGGNFKKLDFYLAKNEVALYPKWNVYNQLFGSIEWQPNMGSTLTGTTPTPSPVTRTTFMPETLDKFPKKDQYTVGEYTEDAQLGMHRFESNRFRFLSNFESFWRDHLSYAQADIVRQIQCANNIFIRTLMYYQAPDAFVAGQGLSSQIGHTSGIRKRGFSQASIRLIENGADALDTDTTHSVDGTAAHTISKSGGVLFKEDVAAGGVDDTDGNVPAGVLSLKEIFKAMLVLQEDVAAPTFDRIYNVPKQSEMVKGKYVLICSTEAWSSLLWDSNLRTNNTTSGGATQLAPANMNLLQDGFAGDLFGKVTAKFDQYPMRFDHNGDWVVPQKYDSATGKVVPNPAYTAIGTGLGTDNNDGSLNDSGNASYEVAFLVGADAFKTIQVGPPPKEFASKNMSAKKFYSMKWNGEVHLTDQFLVPTSGTAISATPGTELNVYGDYLKFISQATFGGIPGDARYCLPIVFKRQRVS